MQIELLTTLVNIEELPRSQVSTLIFCYGISQALSFAEQENAQAALTAQPVQAPSPLRGLR